VWHLIAIVLFTTLIENLSLCSSAEAGIVLNLRLKFDLNLLNLDFSLLVKTWNELLGLLAPVPVYRITQAKEAKTYIEQVGLIPVGR